MVVLKKSRMAQIFEIAATHFDVISWEELRSIPVDASFVHRKVRCGELAPILPGTWACGPAATRIGYPQQCIAGVMNAGPTSAISHVTAAVQHGLWNRWRREEIHVITTRDRRPSRSWPGTFHRSAQLSLNEIVIVSGMPTTSVSRTIIDLGTQLTPHQLASVLDEAAFQKVLDLGKILDLLACRSGSRGFWVVRRAIELHLSGSVGTRSWSEDVFLDAVIAADLPEPVVNTRGSIPNFDHEPDFVWLVERLIVEIDGPGHTKPRRLRLDAAADARLRAAGWRVVRFRAADVRRNPARFACEIRSLLAA